MEKVLFAPQFPVYHQPHRPQHFYNYQNFQPQNIQNSPQNEFACLQNHFSSKCYIDRLYPSAACPHLHRYSNYATYADTCATTDGKAAHCGNFLHANIIPNPLEKNRMDFVATQAPMPHTLPSFLAVLLRLAVPLVVTILSPAELTQNRHTDYWSAVDFANNFPVAVPGTPYQLQGTVKRKYKDFSIRKIFLLEYQRQKAQLFYHYHISGWPDMTAPSPQLRPALLDIFRIMRSFAKGGQGPVMVHCSAGAGRTGTFIVAYFIYLAHCDARKRNVNPNVNVFELVSHVRHYRPALVSIIPQYEFLYQFSSDLHKENFL